MWRPARVLVDLGPYWRRPKVHRAAEDQPRRIWDVDDAPDVPDWWRPGHVRVGDAFTIDGKARRVTAVSGPTVTLWMPHP